MLLWALGLADAWALLPWLSLPLALRVAARTRRETGLALDDVNGDGKLEVVTAQMVAQAAEAGDALAEGIGAGLFAVVGQTFTPAQDFLFRYIAAECGRLGMAVHLHTMAGAGGYFDVQACNDSNRVDVFVFANDSQVLLVARLDNLGKGAAGQAVQNMNLMFGHERGEGLV